MDKQRYILTVQNKYIFKEVNVSEEVPLLRIGTLQECNVRLKRELFPIPVCIVLSLLGNEWHISCNDELCINTKDVSSSKEASIHHGDILKICSTEPGFTLFQLLFSYDFTESIADFDTILDIRNMNTIIIGNVPNAQIRLTGEYIGSEYITLVRQQNGPLMIDATHAPISATCNGIRLFGTSKVEEYDFIGLADYSFYIKNHVLYTAWREDMHINGISSQPLRDETPAFEYPKLNRSPRMIYAFDSEPIEILEPSKKPDKPRDNLI